MSDKKPENPFEQFLNTSAPVQDHSKPQVVTRSEWAEFLRRRELRREQRREQDRYLTHLARAMRGEDPFPRPALRQAKQTAEDQAEIAHLRAELECERAMRLEAENLLKRERIDPASRAGIYRTLFAALVGGYGFRPENEEALASIPGQLINDVADVGGSPDVKTARKHVRAAFEQYKEDQKTR